MTGPVSPVSPVRSDSDHFGLVILVRPVRFACKGNQDGPIPRTNDRTEQGGANAYESAPFAPSPINRQISEMGAH